MTLYCLLGRVVSAAMLVLLLVTFNHNFAEGRVYCQDSHATPWSFHGYSCPVNCNNVVYAVERLKIDDVEKLFGKERIEYVNLNRVEHMNTTTKQKSSVRKTELDSNVYLICEKVLKNKEAAVELTKELGKVNWTDCKMISKKWGRAPLLMKMSKCMRRSYESEFLSVFTRILNKHAHGKYKFTEELTSLIIEKLLGKRNVNLRHGMNDVHKLVRFLKMALLNHKQKARKSSITLRSSHCLAVFVPGCFCLPGFVESFGQCVRPADCFPDELRAQYLPRVIIM